MTSRSRTQALLFRVFSIFVVGVDGKIFVEFFCVYLIFSIIRQSFFSFQNNPKDLDLSCKTDLDLLDFLGRVKIGIVAKFHRTELFEVNL